MAGTILARDLQGYFGAGALSMLDAACDLKAYRQWPSRLLRPSCEKEAPPLKHILLTAFLRSNPSPSVVPAVFESRNRGDKLAWSELDQAAASALQRAFLAHRLAGEAVSRRQLLLEAGILARWRCSSKKLPGVRAWLQEFKAPKAALARGQACRSAM